MLLSSPFVHFNMVRHLFVIIGIALFFYKSRPLPNCYHCSRGRNCIR